VIACLAAAVLLSASGGSLAAQMEEIAGAAHGHVGAAVRVLETGQGAALRGDDHFPMQSVYKLPIGMAVLHEVDGGRLGLDETVHVAKADLVPVSLHSPIRDAHPQGVDLSLHELLRFAISESDGTASDVLLRLAGGPGHVNEYLRTIGVEGLVVANSELEMGRSVDVQYRNWATPLGALDVLQAVQEGRGVSAGSRELLLRVMTETGTGSHRIKGALPEETAVAHKTGTSGTDGGLTHATNDIGIVTLPNGSHLAIAVFVSDSKADEAIREGVIARIARAAWAHERETRPLDALAGAHPKLLLDPGRVQALRASLDTTHRWLWERYLQDVPHMVAVAQRQVPLDDARYDGDLVPDLAFAWLMTGRADLLAVARSHLLQLADDEAWSSKEDLVYLVPAHHILGMALGYDWLHGVLTPAENARVAARLGREAEAQLRRITTERVWWRNQYFQNHSHSNTAALAFAAAALWGEDPRAPQWLETAERFFEKTLSVLPGDGSSLEGYAYAGYGGEYVLLYALLGRELLGIDATDRPWLRNLPDFLLQGLLPRRTADEWAMTFGDAPRRGWTSTAQHLLTLARLHRDGRAQWMARETVGLQPTGLGSRGWMMLLGYDPTVPPAEPNGFPTFERFPEIDQVMMRSSWTDANATLIGFKCGPFMGKTLSKDAVFDFGTGHQDADSGSFQLFSNGRFLAIDPGYTGSERTEDHNAILFKHHGQLGEQAAFGSAEALRFGHYPEILQATTTDRYDYVVGDVTRAYHPALGLRRFVRHLLFVKPDLLLVADEMALSEEGVVHDFAPETLETAGGFSHAPNGYVVGAEGEAFIDFDGDPGPYRIAAVYLDNVPGAGRYSFEVDGRTVFSWTSRNEDRDDNLTAVSEPVLLRHGSRVGFRGAPMSAGTRLTKLSVFSDSVRAPLTAEWLLHLDPKARVRERPGHLEATLGEASLDLHRLLPAGATMTWARHSVAKPEVEPFTFRETTRVVIRPAFAGGEAFLLTLLHSRAAVQPSLEDVEAAREGRRLRIRWTRQGRSTGIAWDLAGRTVELKE
jgi:beta-lactamase class A